MTCLTLRYCQDHFNENQESSIDDTYFDKVVDLLDDKDIKLAIWVFKYLISKPPYIIEMHLDL
ncbi:unnamed protein product [Paramecium pentaurelia]|uniref:Uncharacterized protein n=1 Tax=Paramecium pentaurelia TaxID=43138 RepID=A0A8S1TBR6_9CILI|nr:unnamed protein product [Paramecium pentaurelia]